MKKARNSFEALMRVEGISKRKFGQITGVSGTTIDKYLENPTMLRLKHLSLLAKNSNITEEELLNTINVESNEL
jgi:transcriptional regulator with XRE-family HTH domain|tara:strand:+ start:112 stop:333 length:222 start_codon:yes stop_codon:yes gene_type:complete